MRCVTLNGVHQWPTVPQRLRHLERIASELKQVTRRPLVMLEIGSLFGDSARVLAPYGYLTCVDTWEFENGLRDFYLNTSDLDVRAIRGNSVDVLPLLETHFDLIYVDGCHTWPIIDEDLKQAKRLIAKGGVICGDDLERVILSEEGAQAITPFRHIDYLDDFHPGVSLAVFRAFTHIEMRDGFWWVQR